MDAIATTLAGGSFLIEAVQPDQAFSPEDFNEEQRQTAATADRFMTEEVMPVVSRYEEKEEGLARELIRKAGELGLLAILVPEKFGGLEMDVTSQLVVAEATGRYASFSVSLSTHAGIGTLPIVFFGTPAQCEKYLPRMITGELLASYCLSEPQSGSDALAARTRADLSEDGSHYVLNGQKMWISNGGWADIFTIFAKVDGDKFSAFLVERDMGVRNGAEEHKMGIHGSSTVALYLDNVKVPKESLLGEIGRGHIIAFNILNLGRLKLGASCVGGSKQVLADSIQYAQDRKAFGQPIANFGAIRQKLADMAIQTYVAESVVYRTGGLVDKLLADVSWDDPAASKKTLKSIEEYAIECAICKVVGSEALDFVCDEGVQIHGGYGFHHDYAVERSYRDSRVNRIFEGTNEINRLLTVGMLLKRSAQDRLPLMSAITKLVAEMISAEAQASVTTSGELGVEAELVEHIKKISLVAAGLAYQRFGGDLEKEQEVVYALAEIVLAAYATESALLRARKLAAAGKGATAAEMVKVYVRDQMHAVSRNAEIVLGAALTGVKLDQYHTALRRLTRCPLIDAVAARRLIAERVLSAGRYAL